MWIRSQDKMFLIKCNNFSVECYINTKTNINSFDIETIEAATGTHSTLGSYSTKEKALKVLDKIHSGIIRNGMIYAHEYSACGVKDYDVFQMPQDSEV